MGGWIDETCIEVHQATVTVSTQINNAIAHLLRDPVFSVLELKGFAWKFVDTDELPEGGVIACRERKNVQLCPALKQCTHYFAAQRR